MTEQTPTTARQPDCQYACAAFPMCGCTVEALDAPEGSAEADAAHAAHVQWLTEFDRWEGLTDRQREDEVRRAIR
jgi:hypothetical protein